MPRRLAQAYDGVGNPNLNHRVSAAEVTKPILQARGPCPRTQPIAIQPSPPSTSAEYQLTGKSHHAPQPTAQRSPPPSHSRVPAIWEKPTHTQPTAQRRPPPNHSPLQSPHQTTAQPQPIACTPRGGGTWLPMLCRMRAAHCPPCRQNAADPDRRHGPRDASTNLLERGLRHPAFQAPAHHFMQNLRSGEPIQPPAAAASSARTHQ